MRAKLTRLPDHIVQAREDALAKFNGYFLPKVQGFVANHAEIHTARQGTGAVCSSSCDADKIIESFLVEMSRMGIWPSVQNETQLCVKDIISKLRSFKVPSRNRHCSHTNCGPCGTDIKELDELEFSIDYSVYELCLNAARRGIVPHLSRLAAPFIAQVPVMDGSWGGSRQQKEGSD